MKQLIITVHGIRTFGGWQERLESLLIATTLDCDLSIENYKFGYSQYSRSSFRSFDG